MDKFTTTEKLLLTMNDGTKNNFYCSEHGLFQRPKVGNIKSCPYENCKGTIKQLDLKGNELC